MAEAFPGVLLRGRSAAARRCSRSIAHGTLLGYEPEHSCAAGPRSPQPSYLRYGFVLTGEVKWGEDLLRLDLADQPERAAAGGAPVDRVGTGPASIDVATAPPRPRAV